MLRRASLADADAIAAVFSPSLRLLTFLPELHTIAEDRAFIERAILATSAVTVAERNGTIIAFTARQDDELRLLYTHPDATGQGAGSQLVDAVKADAMTLGFDPLHLWCFQENARARRFYERHGFKAAEFTDGERNEEKRPDIRYVWSAS